MTTSHDYSDLGISHRNRVMFFLVVLLWPCFSFCEDNNEFNKWIIRQFIAPEDLPTDIVRDAIMTRDGSVWLASWGGGVVVLEGTHRRVIDTDIGLLSNDVRVLKEDRDGRIWIGTADGIGCIHNNKIYNFTPESDPAIPPTGSVNDIECMKNGEVWFADGHGYLFAWTPAKEGGDPSQGRWKQIHRFTNETHLCNI